jgi:hypothetical protein
MLHTHDFDMSFNSDSAFHAVRSALGAYNLDDQDSSVVFDGHHDNSEGMKRYEFVICEKIRAVDGLMESYLDGGTVAIERPTGDVKQDFCATAYIPFALCPEGVDEPIVGKMRKFLNAVGLKHENHPSIYHCKDGRHAFMFECSETFNTGFSQTQIMGAMDRFVMKIEEMIEIRKMDWELHADEEMYGLFSGVETPLKFLLPYLVKAEMQLRGLDDSVGPSDTYGGLRHMPSLHRVKNGKIVVRKIEKNSNMRRIIFNRKTAVRMEFGNWWNGLGRR